MQNGKKKHNVTPDRIRAKKEFSHLTEDEALEMIRQMERLSEIVLRHLLSEMNKSERSTDSDHAQGG